MEQKQKVVLLRWLITIACLLSGLLAGGNIYRYVIEVPAWRHLDIASWAEYSRHADLGNGFFLFPLEAIGSAVPLIAASIILLNQNELRSLALPVHFASILAIAGLIFTIFAAPIMMHLPTIGNNPELLRQAFERFHYWGMWRALAQVSSFISCIWAMRLIYGIKS